MAESLRNIRNRIRSIENTWKITRAMQMVSVSKLRRVEHILYPSRIYFGRLENMLRNILSSSSSVNHPLLKERRNKTKVALCVITSDAGLCGSYNEQALKAAKDFINTRGQKNIQLYVIGKIGFSYFKKINFLPQHTYLNLYGRHSDSVVAELVKKLTESFLKEEIGEAYVIYNCLESGLRSKPVAEKVLNVDYEKVAPINYIFEEGSSAAVNELIGVYLVKKLRLILLEAFRAEHSVRVISMKSASDNAKDLIEALVLIRNKVRQASITREVIEIVSSVEALRG